MGSRKRSKPNPPEEDADAFGNEATESSFNVATDVKPRSVSNPVMSGQDFPSSPSIFNSDIVFSIKALV